MNDNGHIEVMNFNSYDYIIVAFSGGKDSIACVLHLLEQGAPKDRITLWHHEIDGREGSSLMDWPVTPDYCRKFAEHMGLPIRFSWRQGGFEKEMLRSDTPTASVFFEDINGNVISVPAGKARARKKPCTVCGHMDCLGCRQKFPQVTANLGQRWCTSYLKIDVSCGALANQEAFRGKRTLFVTGERAEESSCRAKYADFEPHKRDCREGRLKRHIDHCRIVHDWKEKRVWDIIERWNIKVHPCYYLGWGRCSCAACIFGNDNQWASLNKINSEMIERISNYEKQFGFTIHRTKAVAKRIQSGTPYPDVDPDSHEGRLVMDKEYTDSVWMSVWKQPAGAFGENAGPS